MEFYEQLSHIKLLRNYKHQTSNHSFFLSKFQVPFITKVIKITKVPIPPVMKSYSLYYFERPKSVILRNGISKGPLI